MEHGSAERGGTVLEVWEDQVQSVFTTLRKCGGSQHFGADNTSDHTSGGKVWWQNLQRPQGVGGGHNTTTLLFLELNRREKRGIKGERYKGAIGGWGKECAPKCESVGEAVHAPR